MLIKLPPKGEKLLKLYKQYSGEPGSFMLTRFLEEGTKRDKGFQQWLKEQEVIAKQPTPKPAKTQAKKQK